MLDFENFKKKLIDSLSNFYGSDAEIVIRPVKKNNNLVLSGLQIILGEGNNQVVPIMYLERLYERYERGFVSLEELIAEIVDIRAEKKEEISGFSGKLLVWDEIKDHVFPMLLNTEKNSEILQEYVSSKFLDLSVIYYIRLTEEDENGCMMTTKITTGMLENYGLSVDELHATAINNLVADGYKSTSIEDVLIEALGDEGADVDDIFEENSGFRVFTNKKKMYGAAGLLNTQLVKEATGGASAYILPSSIHEVLLLDEKKVYEVSELNNMICAVNDEEVAPEEVLAYHAYYYDADTESVVAA